MLQDIDSLREVSLTLEKHNIKELAKFKTKCHKNYNRPPSLLSLNVICMWNPEVNGLMIEAL